MKNITEIMKQPTTALKLQAIEEHFPHDIEYIHYQIFAACDCFDEFQESDNVEFYLYDFDSFVDNHVLQRVNEYGKEYAEGFLEVYDFLDSDEQRAFVFHKYIKYADDLFCNNYRDWQDAGSSSEKHNAVRKLLYIVEKMER